MSNVTRHAWHIRAATAAAAVFLTAFIYSCNKDASTLTILGEDNPTMKAIEEVSKDYFPSDPITLRFVADKYETMVVKAQNDLAAELGTHDVILEYNTALSNYARNRYVFTLKELQESLNNKNHLSAPVAEDFQKIGDSLFQNAWKETGWYYPNTPGTSDAVPIGFPHTANTMFLAYNQLLFNDPDNKSGFRAKYNFDLAPPTTWGQFRDIAEFFTDQKRNTYGLCMQGDLLWIYYEWANFAYSNGGGVFRKNYGWEGTIDTPVILSSPQTVEATKRWLQMKPFQATHTEFSKTNAAEQIKCLHRGDVAMGIVWSDVAYDLVKTDLTKGSSPHLFAFAPIPGQVSMLAGGTFYVNKATRNTSAAASYIMWLLSPETQKKLILKGLSSPVRSVYEDPEVTGSIAYATALRQSLERGVYMLEAGPDSDPIIYLL